MIQGLNTSIVPRIETQDPDLIIRCRDLPNGISIDEKLGIISGTLLFMLRKTITVNFIGEKTSTQQLELNVVENEDFKNKQCDVNTKYGSLVIKKCENNQLGLVTKNCTAKGEWNEKENPCKSSKYELNNATFSVSFISNRTISTSEFSLLKTKLCNQLGFLEKQMTLEKEKELIKMIVTIDNSAYNKYKDVIATIGFVIEISDVQLHHIYGEVQASYNEITDTTKINEKMSATMIGIIAGSAGAALILIIAIIILILKCKSKSANNFSTTVDFSKM